MKLAHDSQRQDEFFDGVWMRIRHAKTQQLELELLLLLSPTSIEEFIATVKDSAKTLIGDPRYMDWMQQQSLLAFGDQEEDYIPAPLQRRADGEEPFIRAIHHEWNHCVRAFSAAGSPHA